MQRKTFFLSILLVLSSLIVFSQTTDLSGSKKPKLVVGITIEHMRPEYISRFWNTFQDGGFKRLVENGSYTFNAKIDIHNIRTSTVVPTVFTGTYPSEHGIVGDKWYKHISKKEIHAINDDFYLTLGSDSKNGSVSANMLKTYTLGDALKEYSHSKSKVFSVAINPMAAVFSAGHAADGAFWYDGSNGNMITSSYYMDKFPEWALRFNEKKFADLYLNREWDPLLPGSFYNSGFPDNHKLEKGFWNKWKTFPYPLPLLAEMTTNKYQLLPAIPAANKLVRDFASHIVEHNELGADNYTDMLCLTFSSMDFANKWFSPGSVEIHDTYLHIDQEIALLLNHLDRKVGRNNYIVFLTAASTSVYPTNILKEEMNFSAGEFSINSANALLRAYLNALYGIGDWILMYHDEQIFLNHALIEQKEKSLEDMQFKIAEFLSQFEGVRSAIPALHIEKTNMNNMRFRTIENSYCVQRSGDVLLILEEGWNPINRYYEPDYSNENRIPIIFYGSGTNPGALEDPVDVTDIVPTICKYLQIIPPRSARGRALKNVFWYN
jgi:hypothetical protein